LGKLATALVGLLMMGCTFCAVGVWASVVGRGVISSTVIGLGTLLGLWLLGPLSVLGTGKVGELLRLISMVHHTFGFEQGVLAGADLAYFGTVIVVFLIAAALRLNGDRLDG
jgi:hypothetical protein